MFCHVYRAFLPLCSLLTSQPAPSWNVHLCLSSWKQCPVKETKLSWDTMTFPSHLSVKLICVFAHQEAPLLPSLQPRIWLHCLRAPSFEVRVSVTGATLKSQEFCSVFTPWGSQRGNVSAPLQSELLCLVLSWSHLPPNRTRLLTAIPINKEAGSPSSC